MRSTLAPRLAVWLIAAALVLGACASPPPPPVVPVPPPATIETAAPPPAPPTPKTRDALETIRKSLETRMWLLADFDAIRNHPMRDELEASLIWRTPLHRFPELAAGAHRLLITARSGTRNPHWAIAVDHGLGDQALGAVFERLRRRCDDHPIEGASHAVRCGDRRPYLVAAPTPTLVVILRTEHADAVSALTGSGGLPLPKAPLEAHVVDPRETFQGRRMPEVPATIERGYGELVLQDDGGAALLLEGTSATPHQAQADADELNRIVEALDLPGPDILKSALSRLLRFEVEGHKVRLYKELGYEQVRLFMLLVDAMSDQESPPMDTLSGP